MLSGPVSLSAGGTKLVIRFKEGINLNDAKLTLETDESYVLQVSMVDGQVIAKAKRATMLNKFTFGFPLN